MHPDSDRMLHYIAEITRTIRSTTQYERVLSLIVDRIVRSYSCQTCAIALIDPQTEYLRIDQCHNLSLTFCNSFRRRIATSAVGQLLWTGRPIVIPDATAELERAREIQLEHPAGSYLCVQIGVDGRTLGYLHVDAALPGTFGETDVEMLQLFADLAGTAVVKALLQEENLRLERVDRETGLEKFGPFLEKARAAVERTEEFGERFAVLLLDVDNFKETVNTYGYTVSRHLLRELGTIVQARLRPVDAAARYGFDECIVLLANTAPDGAIAAAEELRGRIAEHLFTDRGIRTSVSMGVGWFAGPEDTIDTLLTATKRALFEAQRHGRNTVHTATGERASIDTPGGIVELI